MLATRRTPPPVTIELTVGVQVVSFKVAIYRFTSRAGGAASGGGLDHHERGFVLLRNLCRRKPRLLQRGVLAEQRFLQRPSHTLSVLTFKFLAPPASTQLSGCKVTRSSAVGAT
jgi:hypothetical protein